MTFHREVLSLHTELSKFIYMINLFNLLKHSLAYLLLLVICWSCDSGNEQNRENTTESHATHDDQPTNAPDVEVETIAQVSDASDNTKAHINELLTAYHELKDALVNGDSEKTREAAATIPENIAAFNSDALDGEASEAYNNYIEPIQTSAAAMAAEASIDKQREHLVALSGNLYRLTKAFDANDADLYYQYCPMAFDNEGAYWLSSKQEIRNPYFGDQMLKCGSVREKIAFN